MTDAEQMREAAAKIALDEWASSKDAAAKVFEMDYSGAKEDAAKLEGEAEAALRLHHAIRALPLPPQPPLADDVAGVVERLNIIAFIIEKGKRVAPEPAVRQAVSLIQRLARDYQDAGIDAAAWREAAKGLEGHRDHWKARAEQAEAKLAIYNDLDLCQLAQAPCDYAVRLIAEADTAKAEVARLREAGQSAHSRQPCMTCGGYCGQC